MMTKKAKERSNSQVTTRRLISWELMQRTAVVLTLFKMLIGLASMFPELSRPIYYLYPPNGCVSNTNSQRR
jgi:formate-dependent nitrite reductase membrane component NrfD